MLAGWQHPAWEVLEERRLLALMPIVVTTATDDGSPGTLRSAINEANAAPGPAVIDFAIPGSGVQTITLLSDLPAITNQVAIDGTSQGGPGYTGLPLIALVADTSGPTPPDTGLDFAAGSDGSMAEGLVLDGFAITAIDIACPNSVAVLENEIGTDPSGTMAVGNENGVEIQGADNTIGGTTAADRNVISASENDGILIFGSAATGNVISGNDIGTDLTGTLNLGNLSSGVVITGAPANTIGGTAPGAANVISGNGTLEGQGAGVLINGTGAVGNLVQGNLIGTDSHGTTCPRLQPGLRRGHRLCIRQHRRRDHGGGRQCDLRQRLQRRFARGPGDDSGERHPKVTPSASRMTAFTPWGTPRMGSPCKPAPRTT